MIWLLLISLLSQSFSSLLLQTYFGQKFKPIINNFNELILYEKLNFFSYNTLYHLKYIKPEEYKILLKREKFYIQKLMKSSNNTRFKTSINDIQQDIEQKIVKEFFKGKTILLLDSSTLKRFKLSFPELKLFISEDSVGFNYITYPIIKSHEYSEKIYYALVISEISILKILYFNFLK